jgi:hypothetical protein
MDFKEVKKHLGHFDQRAKDFKTRKDILKYSFNLLKITHDFLTFLIDSEFQIKKVGGKIGLNEAIIKGNLIRIRHLLHSIIMISENDTFNIETIQIIQRVYFEACTNILYLIKDEEELDLKISRYVKKSLREMKEGLNKELRPNELKAINKNPEIAKRIEGSINQILDRLGISEEDITKNNSWGSFRKRFDEVFGPDFYNMIYSFGSSAVHGNFDTVFKYYIEGNNKDGYTLNKNYQTNDYRIIGGILFISLTMISNTIEQFLTLSDRKQSKNAFNLLFNTFKKMELLDESFF